jgi:predicted transposase YbfD/YdcC/predicted secreted protein
MKHLPRRAVPTGPIIPQGTLADALRHLPDPRRPFGWQPQHPPLPLVAILLLTVVALLCGANSYSAIAQWGRERLADQPDLLLALGFPAGQSPSTTTLHRLFRRVDVQAFERMVGQWLAQTGGTLDESIALDGQTMCAVAASDVPASHIVSAYAVQTATVLARLVVPNKGHEQPAVDALLPHLPLTGRLVTFDALHTHRDVCQVVDERGATFLAPVKGNQPTLFAELQAAFAVWPQESGMPPPCWQDEVRAAGGDWTEFIDAPLRPGHGRWEWRRVCGWTDPRWASTLGETSEQGLPWPMVRQVIRVERRRQHIRRQQIVKTEHEVVYFLRNHPASACCIAQQVRAHWRIENCLHRHRDVLFDQDRCTVRVDTAPRFMTTCRDLALTLLHRSRLPNFAAARRSWAARPHLATSFVLSL